MDDSFLRDQPENMPSNGDHPDLKGDEARAISYPPAEGFDPLGFDELQHRLQTESDTICRYCEKPIEGAMVHLGGDPLHADCAPLLYDNEETRPRAVIVRLAGFEGRIGYIRQRVPDSMLVEVVVSVSRDNEEKRILRIHPNDLEEIGPDTEL